MSKVYKKRRIYKRIVGILTELIYPSRCPSCDIILQKNEKSVGFCRKCAKEIKLVGNSYCMICGKPVSSEYEICNSCSKRDHYFTQNKAVYRYSGVMKKAMYKFKYSNRRCYGRIFAMQAVKIYRKWFASQKFDAIVPVPMFEAKERKRGYNQAAVFADALSELTGIPVDRNIVRRNKDTVALKQLNYAERQYNLQKAFKFSENSIKYKQIILVDDIYTTGSTMDAISKELLEHGIKRVYGLSVCIGEKD